MSETLTTKGPATLRDGVLLFPTGRGAELLEADYRRVNGGDTAAALDFAEGEVRRVLGDIEGADPHERADLLRVAARKLMNDARAVRSVAERAIAATGLPPAAALRVAPAGLELAAQKLAPGTL